VAVDTCTFLYVFFFFLLLVIVILFSYYFYMNFFNTFSRHWLGAGEGDPLRAALELVEPLKNTYFLCRGIKNKHAFNF
jgi:hypothetical protein